MLILIFLALNALVHILFMVWDVKYMYTFTAEAILGKKEDAKEKII
jgi:hypothetical protein